ncbi:hypothetical protein BDV98DRAFT_353358 [Pterulicium gracile]|uniref:Uncharacterized protein n=1 Tax=Pterulicium gracile TaxID=1884261 RepID=A0A5C3QSX2_9AGAR|nr:hypothetical protein BDV98DRAFT_353358 [Pterula gracilis]
MEYRNQHQRWPSNPSFDPKTEQRSPDLSSASSNLQPNYNAARTQTFPTNSLASMDEPSLFNAYASSSSEQEAMKQQLGMYPANRPYYGMTQSNTQPVIGNTEFPPTFYQPIGPSSLGNNTHGLHSASPPLLKFQGAGSGAAALQGTSNGAYTNSQPNLAPNVAGRRPGAAVRPPVNLRPKLPPSPESSSLGKRPANQDEEEDGEEEDNKGKPYVCSLSGGVNHH